MNSCESIRGLIPWYITGRIAAMDAEAVESHLDTCAACRSELIEAMRVRAAARTEVPLGDAIDQVWKRTESRLRTSTPRIDVGSFLLGLSFGVSAQRNAVHGSLRVLGQDVRILGRKKRGA